MVPFIFVKGRTLLTLKLRREFGDRFSSALTSEDLRCFLKCAVLLSSLIEDIIRLNSSISSILNSLRSSDVNISAGMVTVCFCCCKGGELHKNDFTRSSQVVKNKFVFPT